MEFKDLLKKYINEKDANISFIANASGITRQAIHKILKGKVKPKVETIRDLCRVLCIFYGGDLNYKDYI